MRLTTIALPALFTTMTLFACGSGDAPSSGSTGTTTGATTGTTGTTTGTGGSDAGPPPDTPIEWKPCSLHSEGDGPAAECATIEVPLDRADPTGKTTPFFVKRYRPQGGTGKTAMWMLQGGPGGSGYAFERVAESIATKFPDIDYYIPDHRGTGRSNKLTCAGQAPESPGGLGITPEEWPACLDEVKGAIGSDLAQFTVSNAANDVGSVAARVREPGQKLALFGGSYGTYWALRVMQLFPDGFDRVVLDSFAPPGSSLARQDQDADEAGRDLLKACGEDAGCAAKLGPDPVAFADALFAKLKTGHCSELVVPPGAEGRPLYVAVRLAIGSFLMQLQVRPSIFPLLYRLDRCNAGDVTALQTFLDTVYPDTSDPAQATFFEQWGFVLSNNITFSELWEKPSPTSDELAAIREASIATREITVDMAQEHDIWPLYPPDEFVGKWPDQSKTPVLVLAGGFDPATLVRKAAVAKEHLTGEGRHFVVIPSATHFVIATSPTTQKRSCGTKIMMSFFDDPKAPDTSCLADVLPVSFEPDPGLSQALFGTVNPWD